MTRRDEQHELLLEKAANAIQRVSPLLMVFDRRKKGRRCPTCAKAGIHTMVWIDPGLPGQGDLYVLFPDGRHGELEVKTGTGKLEPQQVAWRLACETRGIPYLLLEMKHPSQMAECVQRAAAWATYVLGAKHGGHGQHQSGRSTGEGQEDAGAETTSSPGPEKPAP